MSFVALNMLICFLNVCYTPMIYMLRRVYAYDNLDDSAKAKANEITAPSMNQLQSEERDGYGYQQTDAMNNGDYGYQQNYGTVEGSNGFANPHANTQKHFDPLNPSW
jgi:hypothetical protein